MTSGISSVNGSLGYKRQSLTEDEVVELFFSEGFEAQPPLKPLRIEVPITVNRNNIILQKYLEITSLKLYEIDPVNYVQEMIVNRMGKEPQFPEDEVIARLKEELGL